MPKPKVYPNVEAHNKLSVEEIREQYLPKDAGDIFEVKGRRFSVELQSSSSLAQDDFEACFVLLRDGMQEMYERSSRGWKERSKRKEMKEEDMRYLLLREHHATSDASSNSDLNAVVGFLSFMITAEDEEEVVYCYELHLAPSTQGFGLGGRLLHLMEQFAVAAGFHKAMLTVFTENEAARKFYKKHGYTLDEYSPEPRHFRNGTVKMPTYEILSKILLEHK